MLLDNKLWWIVAGIGVLFIFALLNTNKEGMAVVGGNMPADLTVNGDIRIPDKTIFLRGGTDPNHYLKWSLDVDGPELKGFNGGKLTTRDKSVLGWNNNGTVYINSGLLKVGRNDGGWPEGWGNGIHTWDLKSDGTGNFNYLNTTNNVSIGGKITARGGLNLMTDNRNDNKLPSWYRARGVGKYDEFKLNEKIGTNLGGYTYLVTIVPWPDTSGGRVKQIAYTDVGVKYRVGNAADNAWEAWTDSSVNNVDKVCFKSGLCIHDDGPSSLKICGKDVCTRPIKLYSQNTGDNQHSSMMTKRVNGNDNWFGY
jgi:hypothetical protein